MVTPQEDLSMEGDEIEEDSLQPSLNIQNFNKFFFLINMKFIGNRREAFNQNKNSLCTAPTRTNTNLCKKSLGLNESKESFLSSLQNFQINVKAFQSFEKNENNDENIEDCSDKSINEIFKEFKNNKNLIKKEIKMLNNLY